MRTEPNRRAHRRQSGCRRWPAQWTRCKRRDDIHHRCLGPAVRLLFFRQQVRPVRRNKCLAPCMGLLICQLATGCGAANVLISLVCMAETRTRWPRSAGTRAQPPFDTDSPTDHPGSLAQGSVVWNAARSQFSHLLQSLPCSFQVTRHPVALSKTCTRIQLASDCQLHDGKSRS